MLFSALPTIAVPSGQQPFPRVCQCLSAGSRVMLFVVHHVGWAAELEACARVHLNSVLATVHFLGWICLSWFLDIRLGVKVGLWPTHRVLFWSHLPYLVRIQNRKDFAEALPHTGNSFRWITTGHLWPRHELNLLALDIFEIFLAACARQPTQMLFGEHCVVIFALLARNFVL